MQYKCVGCDFRNNGNCTIVNLPVALGEHCIFQNTTAVAISELKDSYLLKANELSEEQRIIKLKLDYLTQAETLANHRPVLAYLRTKEHFLPRCSVMYFDSDKWLKGIVIGNHDDTVKLELSNGDMKSVLYYNPNLLLKDEYNWFSQNSINDFNIWYEISRK